MSEFLANRLEHCKSRPELDQSSDHIPISTRIYLKSEPQKSTKRRAWKLVDLEKLKEFEQYAPKPANPHTPIQIDEYIASIQKFLQQAIDAAVPWARPSQYAKPFWTDACNEATKNTRKLRRTWSSTRDPLDWSAYMKSNDKKQKIIQKAKRLNFCQEISKTTESPQGLWKLAKWAKNASQSARSIPKMPTLEFNGQTASTFNEKSEMLKSTFFPPPPTSRP